MANASLRAASAQYINPLPKLSHKTTVVRLYRQSLKTLGSWCVPMAGLAWLGLAWMVGLGWAGGLHRPHSYGPSFPYPLPSFPINTNPLSIKPNQIKPTHPHPSSPSSQRAYAPPLKPTTTP